MKIINNPVQLDTLFLMKKVAYRSLNKPKLSLEKLLYFWTSSYVLETSSDNSYESSAPKADLSCTWPVRGYPLHKLDAEGYLL